MLVQTVPCLTLKVEFTVNFDREITFVPSVDIQIFAHIP